MKTRIKIRLFFLVGLILTLGLAACASRAETPEAEAPEATEVTEGQGYEPPANAGVGGPIVIDATDACSLLTQDEVATAFGKEVAEVNPDTQAIGTGCEYVFDAGTETQVQISIYEGDAARSYFAGLSEAVQESCDTFLERIFDVAFGQSPTSEQDVSGIPLGDLYTNYIGSLASCMFVQNAARPDVGENVVTAETIFLNWSSNVAVLGDNRVVEFTYQEPIPADAQADFQSVTDRDSMYAAAQPYRDSVLANYTETLIGLLQQAMAQ